jgi:hypothetical protein
MEYYNCPICNEKEKMLIRYKNMVCSKCLQTGIWADKPQKIPIKFGNKGIEGGFISFVNNIPGSQHTCYIREKKCYADEAKFGGIVIQVSNDDTMDYLTDNLSDN